VVRIHHGYECLEVLPMRSGLFCLIIFIAVGMTVGIASAATITGYKFFDYNQNGVKDGFYNPDKDFL